MWLSGWAYGDEPNSDRVSEIEVASEIVIIANASVPVNAISLNELRSIFTMKKRIWDASGHPSQSVKVFVLPNDHAVHKEFCKQQLNIFPAQLEKVWYRMVYTGTGQAPVRVNTVTDMLHRIASTPGAIGYVERHQSDNNNNPEINRDEKNTKILQIR